MLCVVFVSVLSLPDHRFAMTARFPRGRDGMRLRCHGLQCFSAAMGCLCLSAGRLDMSGIDDGRAMHAIR